MVARVPVDAEAVHIFFCPGHGEGFFRPVDENVLVVIPSEDLHVGAVHRVQRPAQVGRKFPFFRAGIEAGIPGLGRGGFVLDGDHLHVAPVGLVKGHVPRHALRPEGAIFLPKLSAVVHIAVGLHECGGTPWTQQQLNGLSCRCARVTEHGQQIGLVPLGIENGVIFRADTGVIAKGKVTAAHVGSAHAVAQSLLAEICLHECFPLVLRQLLVVVRRRFRECAAEALDALPLAVGVDAELVGAIQCARFQRRFRPEEIAAEICGGYDCFHIGSPHGYVNFCDLAAADGQRAGFFQTVALQCAGRAILPCQGVADWGRFSRHQLPQTGGFIDDRDLP